MKDTKKNSFTFFGIDYEFAWLHTQVSTCHAKINTKFSYHDPFLAGIVHIALRNIFAS
jgi:hypothetical protein